LIRNLKILGITLVAGLALSAMAASPGAAKQFHSETEPTLLTAEQTESDLLTTNAGEITCTKITYEGTVSAKTTTTATLQPSYSGCHLIFIYTFKATIDTNGCAYVVSIEAGENPENEGEVEIECPSGKVIEVTAALESFEFFNCTVTVPPQKGLKKATFTNKGAGKERHLTVSLNLTGIEYVEHGESCAFEEGSTKTTANGTYKGSTTIRGYADNGKEGAQVGIWVDYPELHSETEPTIVTAEQTEADALFAADAGEVTCTSLTYEGTVSAKTTTAATLQPSYSGCHLIAIITFNVTIDPNGCAYVVSIEAGDNPENESQVEIECPSGKVIEVTAPGCTVTVPPQKGLKKATFTNKGAGKERHLKMDLNLTGMTYEEHNVAPGNTCGNSTTHTTNGTYQSNATAKGYEDSRKEGAQVGVWVSNPELHSETEPTLLTAEQTESDLLNTNAGEITCSNITYEGTVSTKTTTTATLRPAYSECHLIFFFTFTATINTNGCAYVVSIEAGENPENEAEVEIECPSGKVIEVTGSSVEPFGGCTVTVPPQKGLKKATFTNKGAGKERHLKMDLNLTGIEYSEHGEFCAFEEGSTKTTANGTYKGSTTVRGYADNGKEGARVGIWVGYPELHSETESTIITAEQAEADTSFTADAGEITCSSLIYEGTASTKTATTATLQPAYSGCHLIAITTFNVTIDPNGCAYVVSIEAGENFANEGEVEIECPSGKVIEVTGSGCTVTVPPQKGLKKATFTNKGAGKERHLKMDLNLTGMTYEEHNVAPGNTCGNSTTHTTNGTYQGNATAKGYEDGRKEGAQVGVWVV
jgi:uncharacterized protein YrzB (UPF0473 family)